MPKQDTLDKELFVNSRDTLEPIWLLLKLKYSGVFISGGRKSRNSREKKHLIKNIVLLNVLLCLVGEKREESSAI
jgi:hypothetical protein